jgi:hypothetical protein
MIREVWSIDRHLSGSDSEVASTLWSPRGGGAALMQPQRTRAAQEMVLASQPR